MKSIDVNFRIDGYFTLSYEVPDDYQIPCTNQKEFWKDLKKKAGDQIIIDPTMVNGRCWYFSEESFFLIDHVESVDFKRVTLFENGDQVKETVLDGSPIY